MVSQSWTLLSDFHITSTQGALIKEEWDQVNTMVCSLYVCEIATMSNLNIEFSLQLFTEMLRPIMQKAPPSPVLNSHVETSTSSKRDVGCNCVCRHPAPWISPVCRVKSNGCIRGRGEAGYGRQLPISAWNSLLM